MKETVCLTLCIIIFMNFSTGAAYNCYQCHEEKGQGLDCETNINNILQPNCTDGFQCIKYIWTAGTFSEIYRGCAPSTKCEELAATVTTNHSLEFCETCDRPLCNSAFMPFTPWNLWLHITFFIPISIHLLKL